MLRFVLLCWIGCAFTALATDSPAGSKVPQTPEELYKKDAKENPDDSRIRKDIAANGMMKRVLQYIVKNRRGIPTLTSGYRPQDKENNLARVLRSRGARGRLTVSKHSQHTYGTAADLLIGLDGMAACRFLAQMRNEVMHGRGGIGFEQGASHVDLREGAPVAVGGCANKKLASDERVSPVEDAYLEQNGGSAFL